MASLVCDAQLVNSTAAEKNCTIANSVVRPRIESYCTNSNSNDPSVDTNFRSTPGLVRIKVTEILPDPAITQTTPDPHAEPLVVCVSEDDRILHYHVLQQPNPFIYGRMTRVMPPWSSIPSLNSSVDSDDEIFPANLRFALGVPSLPLPKTLNIQPQTGEIFGSCTEATSTSMIGIVVASSLANHTASVINETYSLDARGRMWVDQRIVQQQEGAAGVVEGLAGEMWAPGALVVSEPFWLGVNCFHPHTPNWRPWYGMPFHYFPRFGGEDFDHIPQSTGSRSAEEYALAISAIAFPCLIIAIIQTFLCCTPLLRNAFRALEHYYRKTITARRVSRFNQSKKKKAQHDSNPATFTSFSTIRHKDWSHSRHSNRQQRPVVHLPSAQLALEKIQTEKQTLEKILTPPHRHRSRSLFVGTFLLLVGSLMLFAVFFATVAVLASRRGVADDIISQVTTAHNISRATFTHIQDIASILDALPDACVTSGQKQWGQELVDQSAKLVGDLRDLLDVGNFVGVRYAVDNTYIHTVVLTLSFVVMCMLLALGFTAFLSSVLSCCLFRWGDSRVICNRTSVLTYGIATWMLVCTVPIAWATLGGLAVAFGAISDECRGPNLFMASGGQSLQDEEGIDRLIKENFMYHYNLTSDGEENSVVSAPGFNLARFFSTCGMKFAALDYVDTLDENLEGTGQNMNPSGEFNPFESILVRAAWHVDALSETLNEADACADQVHARAAAVLGTLQEQQPLLTCGELGRNMRKFALLSCDSHEVLSYITLAFIALVLLLVCTLLSCGLFVFRRDMRPTLYRLNEAERYHASILRKRERLRSALKRDLELDKKRENDEVELLSHGQQHDDEEQEEERQSANRVLQRRSTSRLSGSNTSGMFASAHSFGSRDDNDNSDRADDFNEQDWSMFSSTRELNVD